MNVVFDNIIFSLQRIGGVSIYWYELTSRFFEKWGKEDGNIVFLNSYAEYDDNILHSKLEYIKYNQIREPNKGYLFGKLRRFLPVANLPAKSVFHSSYMRTSCQKDVLNIITVHDLAYEYSIAQKGMKRLIHLYFKKKSILNADGIICISENTRTDLFKFYPQVTKSKVRVIYNGVSDSYYKHNDAFIDNYILFVGDRKPYKNFDFVVKVVSNLRDFRLIVAGGNKLSKAELNFLDTSLKDRFEIRDRLTDEQLRGLYNNAHCLLYPSSYEGFGIPVVEAIRCGCPVITMKNSSLPEVLGLNGLYLDMLSVDSCIIYINKLRDVNFRKTYVSDCIKHVSKFSWDKCYEETFDFYKYTYKLKFED